ncbi:hypothetical protein BD769DRAFT_1780647 [Suillus cothurnatus]|nr:hypothetical protein BD769DRAFT_1780647 [Suillus cothurnatus]
MATQSIDSTHLRQYFEHLAGNTCFMDALQTTSDVDKKLLAFGDDPGLANTVVHLRLLATKNDGLVPGSLKEALRVYFVQCRKKKNAARSEKRTIAKALGLHATLPTAQSLAATGMVKVVIRDHFDDTGYKRGTLLVDCGNEDLVGSGNTTLSVPVDESWYVIEPDESIIFIDSKGSVSLAVLHGKCSKHPDLLTYVNSVIDEAVNDRKGVRPTHGGDLIQFGWNAGPRHARVFAEGTLSWNLLIASLPAEVSTSCIEAINEAGLPSMTVKGNNSDSGYTLDLPDGSLCFSTAEQAPFEGYMSQNYESPIHTDQLYAPYAMNWVTFHSIVDPDQCQLHGDRSSGGNYVDVSLRVVVKCATDTVMVTLSLIATSHSICADNWCDRTRNCNQFFKTHQKAFDEAIAIEGDVKAMVTQLAGEKE